MDVLFSDFSLYDFILFFLLLNTAYELYQAVSCTYREERLIKTSNAPIIHSDTSYRSILFLTDSFFFVGNNRLLFVADSLSSIDVLDFSVLRFFTTLVSKSNILDVQPYRILIICE
jgi:hypothetical protein